MKVGVMIVVDLLDWALFII